MTPLHHAAFQGHVTVAGALIEHGADVHARNWMDKTPLHLAAEKGHCHIVRLLISNGADMLAKTKWNETTANLAMERNHQKESDSCYAGNRCRLVKSLTCTRCLGHRLSCKSEAGKHNSYTLGPHQSWAC
ncbi:ankyrin repeat domain-containing protein 65-like [Chiloscyllium plagiosum]|uniref:ankyrin repeat domain-containing protein 65-like n=1 Tax=Chiloscyllium plagiosum TaxID=36176 RepID=UPI001CB86511|nr:ankyrin repeat domain-containing protein 65-like [Chiloscyllium plagiosum]